MPAWKAWFEEMLQIKAKFCLINYDKMKKNVIEELKPAVQFLGYDINNELETCILKNQEGEYHRPEKSKEEINKILSSIPPGELNSYYKIKDDILEELQNINSC